MNDSDNQLNQKLFNGDPPKVTGLSPKEGPPGTLITIRGENLGKNEDDLIGVSICGVNCLIWSEWKSNSKIIARCGRVYGLGDVIIFTESGGIGTCTVKFLSKKEIITPTTESAVWVDDDEHYSYTNNTNQNSLSPTFLSNSIDFSSESYILENCSSMTFEGLKNFLKELKIKNNDFNSLKLEDESIKYLKTNVIAVIECLDALKSVYLAFKKDKQEIGHDLIFKIGDLIENALKESHDIFDQILSRKEIVDSTRNALNVLQRYRFLFNLPSTIESNIQKKEYDQVINDYIRAKSLFSDTEVQVFKRFYKEVENKIEKFKLDLKQILINFCKDRTKRDIEKIKLFIKYLINLEIGDNPGWECVVSIKETLLDSMDECKKKHLQILNKPEILKTVQDINSYTIEDAPQVVQFIEELLFIFNESFPDLVKLGNFYLNNELYSKESKDELKNKELLFSNQFIQKPLDLLVKLIRNASLPENTDIQNDSNTWKTELNSTFVRWLPHCLRITTNFYNNLSSLELPCLSFLQEMQKLIFDLRVYSLICVLKQAAEEIKLLHNKENWDVQIDDTIGTKTQLPLLFESKIEEILRLVRETILQVSTPDDIDIFTKINVQGQMKQLSQNLLSSFLYALEKTLTNTNSPSSTLVLKNPNNESKILIVLSNCQFTNNYVIPKLQENFDKYNYPDMTNVIKVVQGKFHDLENVLFEDFVDNKSEKIISILKESIKIKNGECYNKSYKPISVSFYVKEIIMKIIEIQTEVFIVAPLLVKKVIVPIIDKTIEAVSLVFEELNVDDLNEYDNLQANIDLAALQYVFNDSDNFKSVNTSNLFEKCYNYLSPIKDLSLYSEILTDFKKTMSLQINSFKWGIEQIVIAL